MQYNHFPQADLCVSAVSLGTWVFGGDVWGGSKQEECLDVIHAAIDHGINLIDTAPIYGSGRSEEIVGKAIKGKRDKVLLATKCGLISKGKNVVNDLSRKSINKEIDGSLSRLQTDYIDIYQIHWPDPQTSLEETLEALTHLKENGRIRFIGISNFDLHLIKTAVNLADIFSLQSQYSLVEHTLAKEIIPYCQENRIGILSYGALAGGILSGKYIEPPKFKGPDARNFFYKHYQDQEFKSIQSILDNLKELKRPFNQVAINWNRQTQGVTTTLVGCRTVRQLEDNVQSVDWEMSPREWEHINHLV